MVDITEIRSLVPATMFDKLSKSPEVWDSVRSQALIYIGEITGADTTPSTRPADLNWIVLPFAWLVEYFANNIITGTSPEYEARAAKKLDSANEYLQEHRVTKPRTASQAKLGLITDIYE